MYQALYRKWRPRSFDDVVGQAHITDTLKRQVELGRLSHAYLFTGTRGTGKTSCAKILSRAVNCEAPVAGNPCNQCSSCVGIEQGSILDVLELDAASNNGVDQVRALRDEAVYTPAAVKKRVYIIDEVHMLSTAAFNALLKILEEPPEHLMFILATTELHKVPATIKSRCQQFSFKRIRPGDIVSQLERIAQREGLVLEQGAAALLARLADGGLRDALSLLDQCIGPDKEIGEQGILETLGLAGNLEIERLFTLIAQRDTSAAMETVEHLYRDGKDMGAILGELSALARDLLICKTAPKGADGLLSGGYDKSSLEKLLVAFTGEELLQMLGILQAAAAELYRSGNRRTDVELCIIRLCQRDLAKDYDGLLARLSQVEEKLAKGIPTTNHVLQEQPLQNPQPIAPQKSLAEDVQDSPPWEEDSLPLQREEKGPPQQAPTVPSVVHTVGETVTEQTSVATASGLGSWSGYVAALRGKLPPSVYSVISKPSFVTGIFEKDTLRIYVDSELTKGQLSRSEVGKTLEEVATSFLGQVMSVKIEVGKAPVPDKLSSLLKRSEQHKNIISVE